MKVPQNSSEKFESKLSNNAWYACYTHERFDFPFYTALLPAYAIWAVQKLENLNGRQYQLRRGYRNGERNSKQSKYTCKKY